jgi:hypothetical protein
MDQRRSLEEIYASIPDVGCTGACFECCSFIGLFDREQARFKEKGIRLPQIHEAPCYHLDWKGQCSIYDDRPLVCRLYGVIPDLKCPFGCKVLWTKEQGHALMLEVQDVIR